MIEENKISRKHETIFYHSPGSIYSYVTHNLGFKKGRHEGKITGLAAFGKSEKTAHIFDKIMGYNLDKLEFRIKLSGWGILGAKKLHCLCQGYEREDIAAGVQKRIEEVNYFRDLALLQKDLKDTIVEYLSEQNKQNLLSGLED